MKHFYGPDSEEPDEAAPEGDALKDGYTTLERGHRGSYSPWGRSGLDLMNDEPPLVHDVE